jgi:glutamine cyclotransferase
VIIQEVVHSQVLRANPCRTTAAEVADPEAVLNGIAYDAKENRIFVTGKLWPKLFEIKIVHH